MKVNFDLIDWFFAQFFVQLKPQRDKKLKDQI